MSNLEILLIIGGAVVIIRVLFRVMFPTRQIGKVEIGMTSAMVREQLGEPSKSDGKTIKENYIKEVLYFVPYQDAKKKLHFKYKVTIENDKVTEIHES